MPVCDLLLSMNGFQLSMDFHPIHRPFCIQISQIVPKCVSQSVHPDLDPIWARLLCLVHMSLGLEYWGVLPGVLPGFLQNIAARCVYSMEIFCSSPLAFPVTESCIWRLCKPVEQEHMVSSHKPETQNPCMAPYGLGLAPELRPFVFLNFMLYICMNTCMHVGIITADGRTEKYKHLFRPGMRNLQPGA